MEYFYVIFVETSEWDSDYEFIAATFEEARANIKKHANWYCPPGTCTIYKINQNFRRIKKWEYEAGKFIPGKGCHNAAKVDHD